MASFIFFLGLIGALLSTAHSLTCSSQSFHNRSFANCDDLPHLDAFLHWTHDPKNSSLSVAFLAPPSRSGGWVAWAVNPTGTGMAGAQAFIASLSGAAPSVRTFNISSYSSVLPAPLSFPIWDLAAENSGDRLAIFATLKVQPEAKSLNHIWQAGPAVDEASGRPTVHEFKPPNLKARGVLAFDKTSGGDGDAVSPAPRAHGGASSAPASAPAAVGVNETTTAARPPGSDKSGVAGNRRGNFGVVVLVGLFGFIWGIISFF